MEVVVLHKVAGVNVYGISLGRGGRAAGTLTGPGQLLHTGILPGNAGHTPLAQAMRWGFPAACLSATSCQASLSINEFLFRPGRMFLPPLALPGCCMPDGNDAWWGGGAWVCLCCNSCTQCATTRRHLARALSFRLKQQHGSLLPVGMHSVKCMWVG